MGEKLLLHLSVFLSIMVTEAKLLEWFPCTRYKTYTSKSQSFRSGQKVLPGRNWRQTFRFPGSLLICLPASVLDSCIFHHRSQIFVLKYKEDYYHSSAQNHPMASQVIWDKPKLSLDLQGPTQLNFMTPAFFSCPLLCSLQCRHTGLLLLLMDLRASAC